jgi:hypothetical protein
LSLLDGCSGKPGAILSARKSKARSAIVAGTGTSQGHDKEKSKKFHDEEKIVDF